MYHLEITNDEQRLMVGILENELSELHAEIASTARHGYKQMLKEREAAIRGLLETVRKVQEIEKAA